MTQRELLIVAVCSGLVILLVLLLWGLRRHNTRKWAANAQAAHQARRRELEGLLAQLDSGVNLRQAYDAIADNRYTRPDGWDMFVQRSGDRELQTEYDRALSDAYCELSYREHFQGAQLAHAACQVAEEAPDRIDAYWGYYRVLSQCDEQVTARFENTFGLTTAGAIAQLNEALQAHYNELLLLAQGGNREAFLELEALIISTQDSTDYLQLNKFRVSGVIPLERPEGWDDMVARYVEDPRADQFERHDTCLGALLLMAAEAEQMKNFTLACIVLAHWNSRESIRNGIPGTLIASLARLVVRLRSDM